MKKIMMVSDISGSSLNRHIGDEAMAIVATERLAKIVGRENIFIIDGSYPAEKKIFGAKTVRFPTFSLKKWRKNLLRNPINCGVKFSRLLWNISQASLVFIAGGGNITSLWDSAMETRQLIIQLARLLGKPVVLVSQTLGPFDTRSRKVWSKLLADCQWVGVRDLHFSGQQLGINVHSALDDAVFLSPEHTEASAKLAKECKGAIGISLHQYGRVGMNELLGLYSNVQSIAQDWGQKVVFVPHEAMHAKGDLEVAQVLLTNSNEEPPLVIVDHVLPAPAVRALTESFQMVIATRYHAIVFALAAGIPAIGIYSDEYTQAKQIGAFEMFGITPYVLPIEEVNQLSGMAEHALSQRNLFQDAAGKIQAEALESSMKPYEYVAELLNCAKKI